MRFPADMTVVEDREVRITARSIEAGVARIGAPALAFLAAALLAPEDARAAAAIATKAAAGEASGIAVRGGGRVVLAVGASGAVSIARRSGGVTGGNHDDDNGIVVIRRSGPAWTSATDPRSGVTVGPAAAGITDSDGGIVSSAAEHGLYLPSDGPTSGDAAIDNGGAITATAKDGIHVERAAASGAGAVTIMNGGAVEPVAATGRAAPVVRHRGAIGARNTRTGGGVSASHDGSSPGTVTIADLGDVRVSFVGIFARTRNEDAAGAGGDVTVTRSGGAVDRDGHVAPETAGLVEVALAGRPIRSKGVAVKAVSREAGVSRGVSATSVQGDGIRAWPSARRPGDGRRSGGTVGESGYGIHAASGAGRRKVSIVNGGLVAAVIGHGIHARHGGVEAAGAHRSPGITVGKGGSVTSGAGGGHVGRASVGGVGGGGIAVAAAEAADGFATGRYVSVPLGNGEPVLDDLSSDSFGCDRTVDGRCRLYEALPSILLTMNGLPTHAERMLAARDGGGAWMRVEAADGEWTAYRSMHHPNVAYDHRRFGVRAGANVAVGESVRLGASAHGLQGSAEVTSGGEAELSGMGVGVHATAMLAGFHVDVQATATWYEMDLKSPMYVEPLKDGVKGRGHAAGVEMGWHVPVIEGLWVTPRAGVAWSEVSLDDFTDEAGGGAEVSVGEAESLKGRAGLGVEARTSEGTRLFGSVDAIREFSEETEAVVSGTTLKASARKATVRVGLGSSFDLGRSAALRGAAGYMMGGNDNDEFDGELSLSMRF